MGQVVEVCWKGKGLKGTSGVTETCLSAKGRYRVHMLRLLSTAKGTYRVHMLRLSNCTVKRLTVHNLDLWNTNRRNSILNAIVVTLF